MTKNDLVIIWLSLCLAVMQWQLYKVVKDEAYNAGRVSVYKELTTLTPDGVCFVKGGC